MKTLDQARTELLQVLDRQGISIAEWARRKGVRRQAVYDILRGKSKGRLGQSHLIAVAIGLKEGETTDAEPAGKPNPVAIGLDRDIRNAA